MDGIEVHTLFFLSSFLSASVAISVQVAEISPNPAASSSHEHLHLPPDPMASLDQPFLAILTKAGAPEGFENWLLAENIK